MANFNRVKDCPDCPDSLAEIGLSLNAVGYGALILFGPDILSTPPYNFEQCAHCAHAIGLFWLFIGLIHAAVLSIGECRFRKYTCLPIVGLWLGVVHWYFTHNVHPLGMWGAGVWCGIALMAWYRLHIHTCAKRKDECHAATASA